MMAKKASRKPAGSSKQSTTENGPTTPAAEDNECRIGDGLKQVRQCYEDVRRETSERLRDARETTLGEVFDRVIVAVKRHPRSSLAIAAALGFFLGRMFHR